MILYWTKILGDEEYDLGNDEEGALFVDDYEVERRLRHEAEPEAEPGSRPVYVPLPRPPHPRLRREAEPEAEPGSRPFNPAPRPVYVPPPRPPHPRLRREAEPEAEPDTRPEFMFLSHDHLIHETKK